MKAGLFVVAMYQEEWSQIVDQVTEIV